MLYKIPNEQPSFQTVFNDDDDKRTASKDSMIITTSDWGENSPIKGLIFKPLASGRKKHKL